MSKTEIIVPDGMVRAVQKAMYELNIVSFLEAALRWQSENAGQLMVSEDRLMELYSICKLPDGYDMKKYWSIVLKEMYLAPVPEKSK